jgi:hypothetical protein
MSTCRQICRDIVSLNQKRLAPAVPGQQEETLFSGEDCSSLSLRGSKAKEFDNGRCTRDAKARHDSARIAPRDTPLLK